MELYGQKGRSLPQKAVILIPEIVLIAVSAWVLFGNLFEGFRAFGNQPHPTRNIILFAFNLVVFVRFFLTIFYLLTRRIPWDEAFSVPAAFALYLVGFPLMAMPVATAFGIMEVIGIVLFAAGSFVNTFAEFQRKRFKADTANRGKLYTGGLFSISMHPNYFGDLLWVIGYACVTRNIYAWIVPVVLFCFFYFFNVPKLDAYLREHYGESFVSYEQRTKRLIPFIL